MNGYFADADKFLASLQESLNQAPDAVGSGTGENSLVNAVKGPGRSRSRAGGFAGANTGAGVNGHDSTNMNTNMNSNVNININGNTSANAYGGHVNKMYNTALDRRSNTYDNAFGRLDNWKSAFDIGGPAGVYDDVDNDESGGLDAVFASVGDEGNDDGDFGSLGARSNTISFQLNNQQHALDSTLQPLDTPTFLGSANGGLPLGKNNNVNNTNNSNNTNNAQDYMSYIMKGSPSFNSSVSNSANINTVVKNSTLSSLGGGGLAQFDTPLSSSLSNASLNSVATGKNLGNKTKSSSSLKGQLGQSNSGDDDEDEDEVDFDDLDLAEYGAFRDNNNSTEKFQEVGVDGKEEEEGTYSMVPASGKSKEKKKKKEKVSHNVIEKKYRNNINDKILKFRDIVPTLRISHKRELGEVLVENDYFVLEGLEPAKKLNKATILAKTIEYIQHLETKCELLHDQNTQLKKIMDTGESRATLSTNVNTMLSGGTLQGTHRKNTSDTSGSSTSNSNSSNNSVQHTPASASSGSYASLQHSVLTSGGTSQSNIHRNQTISPVINGNSINTSMGIHAAGTPNAFQMNQFAQYAQMQRTPSNNQFQQHPQHSQQQQQQFQGNGMYYIPGNTPPFGP